MAGSLVITDNDVMSTSEEIIFTGTPSSRIFWKTSGPPASMWLSPEASEP